MQSRFRYQRLSSLRARLMLLVFLAVIPALGLVLHTAAVQRRTAALETQENLLRLAQFAAAHQRQASEGTRQLLIALSQIPEIRQGDAEDCNQLLANLIQQYRAYAGLGVVDEAGYMVCSAPAPAQPMYVGDRAYFQQARESRNFAIGEYQIGRFHQQPSLGFGYPIVDDSGQVEAVVIAALDLAWLNQLAAAVELPQGAVVTVTDRNGTVLVRYPDSQNWVGTSDLKAPITRIVLNQREGTVEGPGLDGTERLYGFTTLGSNSVDRAVHIRIGVPKAVVVAESNQLLVQNLFSLAGVTVLALAAAWFGGDVFLTRKVQSLVQTAHQLQGGDLATRTDLSYKFGELGELARAFDEMATALEAREQAIAALNQDLQTLFEVIPIGVLITQDAEFKQIRSNPAFAQILGLDPNSNVSSTPTETPPPAYKLFREGRELAPDEFPLRHAALHNTEVKGTEIDIVRGDGRRFNLFGYAKPLINDQGQVRGSVAAFLDISDRKRAEAEREELLYQLETSLGQLEAVINHMTEGLIVTDPLGRIVTFNPVALALHGYATVEQVQQELNAFSDLFELHDLQGDVIPLNSWPIFRAMRGETFSNCEIQVHRRDTGKTWIGSYGGTPVQDHQGRMILTILTVRDITKRHQAQVELARSLTSEQASRAEAEAANRIKDEFLAVLSHELRTPLNPILGWAKLLRSRQYDAATTARALETIERNAQLQTQLIGDLLDVSRILQGKFRLEHQTIDLSTTIQAAIETVQLAATTRSIHLHTRFDPDVGKVSGDSSRLQQVVWNLLSNAVKFSPSGGRVEVTLTQVVGNSPLPWGALPGPSLDAPSPPPHWAQMQVTDTGQGIEPDFLPHVFDTFRQADGATTRQFGGLGLGLAIARHIVELHGGTIAVTSPGVGQGATFVVRLPLLDPSPAVEPDPQTAIPPAARASTPLNGVTVLLVDDEIDTRDVVTFLLKQAGAEVVAVASAAAALATLPQLNPDLLLSDIGMPDTDGYQLIGQIRALPPEQGGIIPAIALTAYASAVDQQMALAAGFQGHLAKPVAPEDLVAAIANLVG